MKVKILLTASLIFVLGCEKNPVDRLVNPLPDGDVSQSSGIFSIYSDELTTGGGVGFIPGGENQAIDFLDQSSPQRTRTQVRFTWNGGDVTQNGSPQHLFAGFILPITVDAADLPAATGRDLSSFGYTKLTLYLRGSLSANTTLRIEGPDDGQGGITAAQTNLTGSTVNSNWTQITLNIPSGHFTNIQTFLTLTFQYDQPPRTTAPGEGGVVYLDDIQYEQ
jgi:hypothetical protein